MKVSEIRSAVESFRENNPHGDSAADCFAPWYLHQIMGIPEKEAIRQSAEGSATGIPGYDYGIDGYYLDSNEPGKAKLTIIQAKYSGDMSYVGRGFRDLVKSLPQLGNAIETVGGVFAIENKVLLNLRADLARLAPEFRKNMEIDFYVLHLCDEDHAILANKTLKAREDLKRDFQNFFPDSKCTIGDIGPERMGPGGETRYIPPAWVELTLPDPVRVEVDGEKKAVMQYGVGRLSELVKLYESYREDLFSKNVRQFIKSKKNTEKGAAGKMKETLRRICISGESALQPALFALYHNGITLQASDCELLTDGKIRIREPYILNGCQTIKNAYFFRKDVRDKAKIQEEKWAAIPVPLRILHTKDEDLVRVVTICNNRQNAISPSALRANDPDQLKLQERFAKAKIYYERQEGAFSNLEDSNPNLVEDEYENTQGTAVYIEDLARAIAAAAGELSLASHTNDLFESENAYNRCFSERRLRSITFLTFLQNVHDVIFLVLKMDLGLERQGDGPRPGRLGYYALCLLVRYLAKENRHEDILERGTCLTGRDWPFRKYIGQMLDNRHSGIKGALSEKFLCLTDTKSESMNDAFQRAQASLRLRNDIDVFEAFANLDDSADS